MAWMIFKISTACDFKGGELVECHNHLKAGKLISLYAMFTFLILVIFNFVCFGNFLRLFSVHNLSLKTMRQMGKFLVTSHFAIPLFVPHKYRVGSGTQFTLLGGYFSAPPK